MAKIFVTGITGFLGSNIARYLVNKGHDIVATYRQQSSKDLCNDYAEKVIWILQADNDWVKEVNSHTPEVIIHAAWIGVSHAERDDWDSQYLNVIYLQKVLEIAYRSGVKKFISLGSQAEYGTFNKIVNEEYPVNPTEAYGRIKLVCSEIVKQFCNHHNINWYWLRLFTFFGRGESKNWLIPSMVAKMQTEQQMDFTPGEQKYAYLYVDDLSYAVDLILKKEGLSGIYNISGKHVVTLKSIIERIRDLVNTGFRLNFGALNYRSNQSMHMQGNADKFINEFGEFEVSDFNAALMATVEYLKTK